MRKICSIVHLVVIVAVAAVFFAAGGGALCRAEGAAQNSATPLLSGGNPDPTVCRVGDEYYIVTSSFSLSPGLPVYHSRDMVNWQIVSHAWRESWPCKTPDDGIWAPTLRHHNGVFYLTVTWHDGFKKAENYLLTAKDPAGPWSKPLKIDADAGIDGSLFFDGEDAWYLSNQQPSKQKWRGHCQIWMQRIDLANGHLLGEKHVLTDGFGDAPAFAEGPHLYKIGGKYLLLHAQGGTAWGHEEVALVSDCVTGPYVHVAGNPVLTAKDRGRNSPLQAFGHADLVQMPDGEWRAVFLGMRMADDGAKCPLGRETFSCRVDHDGDGLPTRFRRDELIAGDWSDPAATRYSLLDRPGDPVRYVKVRNLAARVDYPDKPFRFCAALAADAPRRAVGQSLSLDGMWRFSFQGGEERVMPVPSCWELQGVGTLRYGEADAKESGRYSRTFAIPSDWPSDDLVILRFDGVMFGAHVTVNGKDAGSFRSSFNRNELDITALVRRDAPNDLIVETLKNPKGWGFDCNDDWILHGIFRSVTLISRPRLNVSDLSLACKVDAEGGSAAVKISAAASDGTSAVRLRLVDADGKTVLEGAAPLKGVVENARLWTCETPNIYTLVAEVGRDRVEKRVGLREITRDGAVLKLNGRPIKLHGVNHHDLCPCHGRAITIDELRRDAQLIKDGNFNCVRLAHYPPNEAFLDLCDELGLYAIDEVPFGMGTKNLRNADYFEVLEERARLTVSRDKLHPSVIAWTVGNENPLTDICVQCGDLVSKLDPTRPTCYPQYSSVYEKMLADGAPPSAMLYDFHYVDAAKIRELAPRLDRPLFAGEFAHALGLDFGSLTETWEEMWKRPECAGGCIWMFQDQGIARPASAVKEKDRKWLAWADEKTVWDTHGIDGCDGTVYADRTPQVDYYAARAVFAPVKMSFDGKKTLTIENRYDFTNLSELKISWQVSSMITGESGVQDCRDFSDSHEIAKGAIPCSVPPHSSASFTVELPEIAEDVAALCVFVEEKSGNRIVCAKAWPLKVDVKTTPKGTLPTLVFEPRWDRREMMSKSAAHLPKKNKKKYSILEKPAGFAADVKDEPLGDGSLHVAYEISATQEWHTIEAGLSFTLQEDFTTVRWVGQGPFEAYTLSNAQSIFGWWELSKEDLYFAGNRRDVRWLAALRGDGTGVALIPDGGTGDVAFENVGGRIRISHNAALADKFNKYEWPRDVKAFAAGEKLSGGFTLVPVKCHPGAAQPFRPFFKSYDDGGAKVSANQVASPCEAALREGFANPPPDVKIGCYYYWVNERVDEEGVKKDLQWMKENGITRAFLATDIRNRTRFENPWKGQQFGDCTFRSEKWWRCLRTAFRTAGELGIEMGIFNGPGWSQSGGPWVAKEDAQIAPDGTYPENGPCSPAATGYEVDKTNRAAVRRHFDAFVGDILRRIPPAERPTLTTVVIDSWERGRVVKPEGDQRKLSDIIAEEYMGELTRCAHENGLITWCEPYSHSRGGWDGDSATYGAASDEVSAEFWAGEPKNERAKEIKAALDAARLGGKNKIYAESFTAGSWTKHAKDDWSFESLKPYADKFFRKGVNATILHVVISQPGDETEPPVRPWFGTFFDRRSRNAAEMKKLVPYLRRCNFMLQQGRAADGRTDTRLLPDGTRIRFTEQSLFEVVFPGGRTETWNPVSCR